MSDDVLPGGNRRIDRVLAEDFLDGLREMTMQELRAVRGEAEQEETDISYLRRLLQGRLDIVNAELQRRRGGGGDLVADLKTILADGPAGSPHGLGRHSTVEPSRADVHRRRLEVLVADLELSDVQARTDAELERALQLLGEEERTISERRREVQRVVDAAHQEITRRYRDGEADVDDVLPTRERLD